MNFENGKITFDIYDDIADEIVIASLKDVYERSDICMNRSDVKYNKKLKKALRRVIKHYAASHEYEDWINSLDE